MQNSIIGSKFLAGGGFFVGVAFLLFVPFSIYWVFETYKEYRGCMKDANHMAGGMIGGDMESAAR